MCWTVLLGGGGAPISKQAACLPTKMSQRRTLLSWSHTEATRGGKGSRANESVAARVVLVAPAHPLLLVWTPSPFFGSCGCRCVADLQVCWRLEAEGALLLLPSPTQPAETPVDLPAL